MTISIGPTDPTSADAEHCLRAYFADLAVLFEEDVALEDHDLGDPGEMTPPRGVFLVARLGDRPVGCGVLTTLEPGTGYIQRMWVDGSMRGRGLGSRILAQLEEHAREFGHRRIRLYTHRNLESARALYLRRGYVEVEPFFEEAPFADHFFEKAL